MAARYPGTTTRRGYGWTYQRMRPAVFGRTCHICRRPGADTIDHLVPLSVGGRSTLENMRPAHRGCNSRKARAREEAMGFPNRPGPPPHRARRKRKRKWPSTSIVDELAIREGPIDFRIY
jgi:5-methylcytosine-specific restriction endonuclease McrA